MQTSAPPGPPGYLPDPLYAEKQRLFQAVDRFALDMKARLAGKLDAGWTGWEDEDILPREQVFERLLACARKAPLAAGQEADIANFALFLWRRRLLREHAARRREIEEEGLARHDADPEAKHA